MENNQTNDENRHIWVYAVLKRDGEEEAWGPVLGPFFKTEKDLILAQISNLCGEPKLSDEQFEGLFKKRYPQLVYGKQKILQFRLSYGNYVGKAFDAVAEVMAGVLPSVKIYSVNFRLLPAEFSFTPGKSEQEQIKALCINKESGEVTPRVDGEILSFASQKDAEDFAKILPRLGSPTQPGSREKFKHGIVYGVCTRAVKAVAELIVIEAVVVTKADRKNVPY